MTERYAALQGRYTTKEAAAKVGIHPVTLRIWSNKGLVPGAMKVNGRHYFYKEAIDAWVKSAQVPTEGKAA